MFLGLGSDELAFLCRIGVESGRKVYRNSIVDSLTLQKVTKDNDGNAYEATASTEYFINNLVVD